MLQRSMMPQQKGNKFALMAADNQQQGLCGVKAIVFAGPEAKKAGTSQGIVPLFDSRTGALVAIVEAECITAVRTAATSGAATQVLADPESRTLAILGAGRIGRLHIDAVRQVRPIQRVQIWNRTPAGAESAWPTLQSPSAAVAEAAAGAAGSISSAGCPGSSPCW